MSTDAAHFKAWLKQTKRTYRDVANANYKSVSWIGQIANGHYPWYTAGQVPKGIWEWARTWGMPANETADDLRQAAP
jgi:hypothetical protein